MTKEQGVLFLKALGVQNPKVKGNGWILGHCPLARWLHNHQQDNHASFGLKVENGQRSYFNCFACQSGSASDLVQTIELYSKGSVALVFDFKLAYTLLDDELAVVPLPEYGEFQPKNHVFQEWPEYWLYSFPAADMIAESACYLKTRNISDTTRKMFQLKYDSKRRMILCPYFDAYDRFAGARGRSILPDAEGPNKHWDYRFHGVNNAGLVWYNETVLNLPGPVVTVEGQFDVWRTVQAHQKTVGALTARPTIEKFKKLCDSDFIIHIPDNDKTGDESVEYYQKMGHKFGIKVKTFNIAEGAKDPDECHVDYLKHEIEALL